MSDIDDAWQRDNAAKAEARAWAREARENAAKAEARARESRWETRTNNLGSKIDSSPKSQAQRDAEADLAAAKERSSDWEKKSQAQRDAEVDLARLNRLWNESRKKNEAKKAKDKAEAMARFEAAEIPKVKAIWEALNSPSSKVEPKPAELKTEEPKVSWLYKLWKHMTTIK